MKKYYVESLVKGETCSGTTKCYECENITFTKNWTGDCIRLEDVNTVKGKQRKQLKKGLYVTINKMSHWESFKVVVYENGTTNIIYKWEA